MKKILSLSFIFILIASASFAQRGPGDRLGKQRVSQGLRGNQFSRPEKFQLRKDIVRLNTSQRNARRDGIVTPNERKRIHKAKCNTRRDAFRFKRNGRR